MANAIPGTRKKRGRPKVGAVQVQVRIPPDMLAALDKFVDDQSGISRPEAIRRLLRDYLITLGYLEADE